MYVRCGYNVTGNATPLWRKDYCSVLIMFVLDFSFVYAHFVSLFNATARETDVVVV